MFVFAAVAFSFALMYIRWRVKYQAPPLNVPQVICFHKISRRFLWEGTWTTPERFFGYIDTLLERGYRFIGEAEFLDALDVVEARSRDRGPFVDEDDGDLDPRLFLTFDDGYREILTEVAPGLVERGVPFHVFLVTDFVGQDNVWDLSLGRPPTRHLSWEDVMGLQELGVTFGAHTRGHDDLTRLSPDAVRLDIGSARAIMEERLGTPVRTLSYPFGRYNEDVRAAAKAAGYDAAFSLYPRHSNRIVDRYALRRNGVYVIDPIVLIEAKIHSGPLFWFEEMKGRTINSVASLTPLMKRSSPAPGIRH